MKRPQHNKPQTAFSKSLTRIIISVLAISKAKLFDTDLAFHESIVGTSSFKEINRVHAIATRNSVLLSPNIN